MNLEQKCFSCGEILKPGGLAYRVRIQMAADFDGYIDGDSLELNLFPDPIDRKRIDERTAEELEEEVYRERTLKMCKSCAESAWKTITSPFK
jgi:hypothetical protein